MNEFKVGLMALATMAAIVYMSLKVTSNQSGFGDYIPYRTIVRDASGIFPKTPIRVAGINAGRINEIELQGNNALITFEVLERVKITKNSRLKIKSVGFLGDKYLEIYVGDASERLEENALIVADEGGGVEHLVRDASEVMGDVKIIVKRLKDSLAPDGKEPPVKQILDDVKEITGSMKSLIAGNESKLQSLIDNLERFSEDIAYQVDEAQDKSAMADVKQILASTKKMTEDLQQLVSDIKSGKGTLGKILVEEEIADEVRETLSGVKKIVNKVNSIRTELAVYTGVNTDYGGETEASLKLFPSPERFYLLGISTSEFGPEKEKYVTTTPDGGTPSTEITKTKYKNTYRFNVQLGRKIHNWSFRGGLIESTGGLGVDYEIPDWGLKFLMDVFDYREDIGVNLRLSSTIQIWNVFHGKLAFEDLIEDSRSATISLGLQFTDEDLKGLIGFFF